MSSVPASLTQPTEAKNKRPRLPSDVSALGIFLSCAQNGLLVNLWDYNRSSFPPADATTSATPWNHSNEEKRSESYFKRPCNQQIDVNGNGNFSLARAQTEVPWLSSPHSSVTQFLSQDMIKESQSVSASPLLSGYPTTQPIKLNNGSLRTPVEEGNKVVEGTTSCRLFGIELISQSTSLHLVEKQPVQLSVSSGTPEGHVHSVSSAAELDQKSDLSKGSRENKQAQPLLLGKAPQAKQSSASTRSRTKVRVVVPWLSISASTMARCHLASVVLVLNFYLC